jgi:fumarylacetoacetase
VVSGTPIRRPNGQLAEGIFGPTRELDYELEIGAFIGPGNTMGEAIPIDTAEEHIAGICLVNDWSARDIQRWEYQPLGPFLGKNFGTSISPWMVTREALEPFRTQPPQHDAPVLPYLQSARDSAFEITLEVHIKSHKMSGPDLISRGRFQDLYWTLDQMVAHHTSNGCPLHPGDLIASGTISGPQKLNRGCLLELTARGSAPLALSSGEQRTFLEDGDLVIMTGFCSREGYKRIGLGECAGQVLSAR